MPKMGSTSPWAQEQLRKIRARATELADLREEERVVELDLRKLIWEGMHQGLTYTQVREVCTLFGKSRLYQIKHDN